MASGPRERMGEFSEFVLLVGERIAEAAYRLRVEAVKATRIGRIRMETVMLRRDRRSAVVRLGEAAHVAVRDARVADPVLVSLAREVDDVDAAIEAKAREAARIADLPDEQVLKRPTGRPGKEEAGAVAGPTGSPDGGRAEGLAEAPVTREGPVETRRGPEG